VKIDGTHLKIMKHLRNGRESFRTVADKLGITEKTVRTRVSQLLEEGAFEITGRVDPEAMAGHDLVFVGVKLNSMDLIRKGEEFSKLKGVISVNVVTGQFDLIVVALLNQEFKLLEFYAEHVSQIKDIQSVETFVSYKGYNSKVPYVL